MLEINAETPVPGPGQVQNTFDADPSVSAFINILKQGQSEVINGNLLTLPVGGGLLYVQPVFVQSSGSTKLPTLQKVLVAFGNQVAFEHAPGCARQAVRRRLGRERRRRRRHPVGDAEPGCDRRLGSGSGATGGGTGTSVEFQAALKDAQQAMLDRQSALTQGDWTKYGEADARLTAALQKLIQLEGQG
jgi:uncharacterized membrane protein (UPF0182 family)